MLAVQISPNGLIVLSAVVLAISLFVGSQVARYSEKPIRIQDLEIGQSYMVSAEWDKGVVIYRASDRLLPAIPKQCVIWEGVDEKPPLPGQRFWIVRDPVSAQLRAVIHGQQTPDLHVDVQA